MASRKEGVPLPSFAAGGSVNQGLPIRYGWKKNHKKAVLPVFGKRSVDSHEDAVVDSDAELDKLIDQEEHKHFTRHHRQTRHALYDKIEVYLNS